MKRLVKGFIMSMGMYTVLPVPRNIWDESASGFLIAFYPLQGAIIGGLWFLVCELLKHFGCPIMISALLFTFVPFWLSGGLHLDGFMDTMDAICSRREIEEKKRILKDSHTGAFAVIGFGFCLLSWFVAGYTILSLNKSFLPLLLIPIASRSFTGFCVLNGKPLSENSYIMIYQKDKKRWQSLLQCGYLVACFGIALIFMRWQAVLILTMEVLGAFGLKCRTQHEFGGISGDLSGFILTLSELIAVLTLALI